MEGPMNAVRIAFLGYPLENAAQHSRLDVASTHDGYRLLSGRQLVAVEQSCCQGHRAAGLGEQPGGKNRSPHRLANLIFCDGHNAVYVSLHVSKIQRAYALRS